MDGWSRGTDSSKVFHKGLVLQDDIPEKALAKPVSEKIKVVIKRTERE